MMGVEKQEGAQWNLAFWTGVERLIGEVENKLHPQSESWLGGARSLERAKLWW
jgi:hypothetical protein